MSWNPLSNHDTEPLVTVQVMCCPKDLDLLPRALASVVAQDLSPDLMAVQIMHDGPVAEEKLPELEASLSAVAESATFEVTFAETPEFCGYYCLPRNLGLIHITTPYVAFLDADNEMLPGHLSGLLRSIRSPSPNYGWPHFVYSRRRYVRDPGVSEDLPEGRSPFIAWDAPLLKNLLQNPGNNFIDTGDILIGRGVLHMLAEKTGQLFNSEMRRFGDWELVSRLARTGFRARAVNQITNVYHWTGKNLQVTRGADGIEIMAAGEYRKRVSEGRIQQ